MIPAVWVGKTKPDDLWLYKPVLAPSEKFVYTCACDCVGVEKFDVVSIHV